MNYVAQERAYTFTNSDANSENPYYLCAFDDDRVGVHVDKATESCFWQIERLDPQNLLDDKVVIKIQAEPNKVLETENNNTHIGASVKIGERVAKYSPQQTWKVSRPDKPAFVNVNIRTLATTSRDLYLTTSPLTPATLQPSNNDIGQVFSLLWLQSYNGYIMFTQRNTVESISNVCREGVAIREISPRPINYRNECIWDINSIQPGSPRRYISSNQNLGNVMDVDARNPSPIGPGTLVLMFGKINNPASNNQLWEIIQG